MIVYADVLIFINTLVNYFMLLAVGKISRGYIKRWRILLGAFIGGVSSLLIFLDKLGVVMTLLKILSGILMVLISFKFENKNAFLRRCFWLFVVCFLFGGFMMCVCLLSKSDSLIYTNGIVYFNVDITFLVVCSVISYGILSIVTYLTDKKAPKNKEYIINIKIADKNYTEKALMDTGNSLREPFCGYPVIMADKDLFNRMIKNIENEKIRYIPINTVGGETLIKAFKPEKIIIDNREFSRVYVGESIVNLNQYKIILNINLEGEIKNEKAKITT